jgi:hypothetical protein
MAAHPAFRESLRRLRTWGVRVLFGKEVLPLPPPGAAAGQAGAFPWELALAAVGPPHPMRPPRGSGASPGEGRLGFVAGNLRRRANRLGPAPPMEPRPAPAILRAP